MKIGPIDFDKILSSSPSLQKEEVINSIFNNEIYNNQEIGDLLVRKTSENYTSSPTLYEKQLPQKVSITTKDGFLIEISDSYEKNIPNDDSGEFINIDREGISQKITIKDLDGNKHQLEFSIYGYVRDLIDLRRQSLIILNYLAKLPPKELEKFFKLTYIVVYPPLSEDGCDIDGIPVEELDGKKEGLVHIDDGPTQFLNIYTSELAPLEREFRKNFELKRDDGYSIQVSDAGDKISSMLITTPAGDKHNINILGSTIDETIFYLDALPVIAKLINNLPQSVLDDVINEISNIHVDYNNRAPAGQYFKGTNDIAISFGISYSIKTEERNNMIADTFVHELGHSIDALKGEYNSEQKKEFVAKFEEFKKLVGDVKSKEFVIVDGGLSEMLMKDTHMLQSSQEIFAIFYNNSQTGSTNHIDSFEDLVSRYRKSNKPEEKRAVELYDSMKKDAEKILTERRSLSKSERCNEELANFIKSKISPKDIENYKNSFYADAERNIPELEIIDMVFMNDSDFSAMKKNWMEILSQEAGNIQDVELESSKQLWNKIVELRNLIKINQ